MDKGGFRYAIRMRTGRPRARRGAAAVEMAIVSPILLMLLLGMIEFGYIFMIGQSLTNATREAARTATLPGATDAMVIERFQQAVAPTGLTVDAGMISITHATPGNPIVNVSVQVPYQDVTLLGVLPSSLFSGWFGSGGSGSVADRTVGSSCSMRVEGVN